LSCNPVRCMDILSLACITEWSIWYCLISLSL
jgi:hypothetical protein